MRNSTRFGLVAIALAAAAVPAFADTVTVNASAASASRQLKVLDMAGNALSTVSLTPGKAQPFQVQVVDSGFSNLTSSNKFSVSATMNNLYKVTGANAWDFATSIPSSDLSIDYQTNPIRAFSPLADALGNVTVAGTLPTCSGGVISGLPSILTDVISSNGLALATLLCTQLGAVGQSVSAGSPIALPAATTLDLSSLLPSDLPFNLGSTLGTDYQKGPFSSPDYSNGTIGGNGGNSHIPGGWTASDATSLQLLSGKANLTAQLTSTITSALNAVLQGQPLSSATGSGAVLPVASVIAALNSAGGSLATLAGTLSQIPAADAAAIINKLTPSVVAPTLAGLTGIGGTSVSLPVLSYSGATSVPAGNYQGTMTVTLLSQ